MAAAVMVLAVAVQARAQQRELDTTRAMHIELLEPGLDSGGAVFSIPLHLTTRPTFTSPTFFLEGVPAAGESGIPGRGFEVKQDLLAPLRVQWAREAETRTFRTIMGSVQFAGVAFLAARQLAGAGIMTAKPRPARSRRK
jgi:hypothetical protein